jgi:arginyl-tRNA synthetase
LHVGHLRNLALGQAIATALEAAGGRVLRQSVVCDMGRNVCEAAAGYVLFGDGVTPEQLGLKPDVFVGEYYARYIQDAGVQVDGNGPAPDLPIGRELELRNDLADDLFRRWAEGDPEIRTLAARVRDWCLRGQDQTTARLGIRFDRMLFESEAFDLANHFVQEGVSRELFRREESGGVVYDTGRPEYKHMPLLRADGLPTEHLRALILWARLQERHAQIDGCIHVMGDEWLTTTAHREAILKRLGPCPLIDAYHKIPYGMVHVDGSKMKSSSGKALLIDELLDRLAASDKVARLAGVTSAEELARIIALGYFLDRPTNKAMDFSWERLTDTTESASWALAAAWARARRYAVGAHACDSSSATYRFAVLQAQRFRTMLALAVSRFDVMELVRYAAHLSRWYLKAERGQGLARVICATLGVALVALGLITPRRTPNSEA